MKRNKMQGSEQTRAIEVIDNLTRSAISYFDKKKKWEQRANNWSVLRRFARWREEVNGNKFNAIRDGVDLVGRQITRRNSSTKRN